MFYPLSRKGIFTEGGNKHIKLKRLFYKNAIFSFENHLYFNETNKLPNPIFFNRSKWLSPKRKR
jgi:hypothetical protein